jgi:uncharacterized membrane protein YphA (DoxX/SURF4 family)
MAECKEKSNYTLRNRISITAAVIIGVVFLISGSGKVFGYGEIPGQTVEFVGMILPDILLTPFTAKLIYNVFIPYILPWAELAMGVMLLIGFVPRFIAVLVLPLSLALMGNNIYAIGEGYAKYPSCECFGIWEELFGGLTPVQSLGIDIVLFILALVIVIVAPLKFFSSRRWLANLGKKEPQAAEKGEGTC